MTRAFSYLRCSGLGQTKEDKDGLPRQHDNVAAFAAKHGYNIIREFCEAVSGRKHEEDRPVFAEMIAAVLDDGVRHVLVESLQRLAREYRIQEQLLIYLASKGIQLIACDTGENITEAMAGDPMRKALVQIQGIFAELDRSQLVRKLARARKRIRDRGERCDGQKPYGFRPGEDAAIKVIRKLHEDGKTLLYTATCLNKLGFKPRKGNGRWHPQTVKRAVGRA